MATSRICDIVGCNKPHEAHGYCKMHYRRSERGLPMTAKTLPGEPMDYLENVCLSYDDKDACLTWPFARIRGYGSLAIDGDNVYVSRYICEKTHGPPPSPGHYAAHSCNKGHLGCVSRFHVDWKTPSENSLDKNDAGTMIRGTKMHGAILDEDKVIVIRAMKGRLSISKLAKMFGIGHSTVWSVQSGKKWAWLDPP